MRVQRGFTIIELIITLVVMGILLILGVVNLTSSQTKSRDTERQADVSNISSALESYYTSGSDDPNDPGTSKAATNTYPAANDLVGDDSSGNPAVLSLLRDLDTNALKSPNGGTDATSVSSTSLVPLASPTNFNTCLDNNGGISAALSCISTGDPHNASNKGDANAPTSKNDTYLYVPYTLRDSSGDYHYCGDVSDGTSGECSSYSLFYWNETQKKVIEVDSRHDD